MGASLDMSGVNVGRRACTRHAGLCSSTLSRRDSVSVSETIAAAEIGAHSDMKAIYATSGQEVVGAAAAVKAVGKAGKIGVYGYDAEPNEVAPLKQGIVFGLIAQSPRLSRCRRA